MYQLPAANTHTGLLFSPDQQVNVPLWNPGPSLSGTFDGVNVIANQSDQQTSVDLSSQGLELPLESELPRKQTEDIVSSN